MKDIINYFTEEITTMIKLITFRIMFCDAAKNANYT